MSNYPSPKELEVLYSERDARIDALSRCDQISTTDIQTLDRLGRFRVADELWLKCDQGAQSALLGDEHAHVRSAANWRCNNREAC